MLNHDEKNKIYFQDSEVLPRLVDFGKKLLTDWQVGFKVY